jgi:putative sterol carrier protein
VQRIYDAFWRRYEANPEIQRKLAGKSRVIQVKLTDGEGWIFNVGDGKLQEAEKGHSDKPDVIITVSREDLFAMFNKELKPLQAYMSGRVKVKASFRDIFFAKSLLGW